MRASVVVPTYQRPALLDRCLAALVAQDVDRSSYEILVADDAARPETRQQVEEWAHRSMVTVRYVAVTETRGPAGARNAGGRQARGDVLAFTDDDCIPDPGWLAAGLDALDADPSAEAANGRVIVPLGERPTDYERDAAGLEHAEFVTANCFCRRDAFETLGGFDERFTDAWREDSDLHFRLLARGGRITSAPSALVVHPVRPAAWGISLRQQRKSQFDALLYKKHPVQFRQRIPGGGVPWGYYAAVGSAATLPVSVRLGAWGAAALAAAVWVGLTARFCARRLHGTTRAPAHVAEMLVTSAMIPPVALFWRLYGAAKFRTPFL